MKKLVTILGIFIIILVSLILSDFHSKTKSTITYFPPDESIHFSNSNTSLHLQEKKDSVQWKVSSQTDEPLYLRQDISIVYVNGVLKAIHNKWLEQTDLITFQESFKRKNGIWKTITLHHGESHHTSESIKSIQEMSHDTLYIQGSTSFHTPSNPSEQAIKKTLEQQLEKDLQAHWDELIDHFEINRSEYEIIPFTQLYEYEEKPFPSLTNEQTRRIMGQLWEGLYKNYLLPIVTRNKPTDTYVPIILLNKNHNHLLVLYEANHEKKKLIQKISSS